jgi:hypothetical protein
MKKREGRKEGTEGREEKHNKDQDLSKIVGGDQIENQVT